MNSTQRYRFFVSLIAVAFLLVGKHSTAGEVVGWSGGTMGTSYNVKIYVDDLSSLTVDEVQAEVDAELRRVSDEMSTYQKSSEISRFNGSASTDWFPVSRTFASVVEFALKVSQQSGGAFDITIGPAVDAWGFGPVSNGGSIPTRAELESLRTNVGFKQLDVRMNPPSLRKQNPALRIDLSAIAKGHGVDRVIEKLQAMGYPNVFVEIGGEVRATGSKGEDDWKVGIQVPDMPTNEFDIAWTLAGQSDAAESMATSGDYRNYVEIDGVRYSHTIDPRTLRPIIHDLASVSVISDRCMESDAWATALNVLGEKKGSQLTQDLGISALFLVRDGNVFWRTGTGQFRSYTRAPQAASSVAGEPKQAGNQTWVVLAITFVAFAVLLFAMAIGVIFSGKSISGSCGGIAGTKSEDGSVSCSVCSNPADACKELRERMQQKA